VLNLSVGAVNLGMKRKVGGEALGLRGMYPTGMVADDEAGGCGLTLLVADPEGDGVSRQASEEKIDLVAEAKILRALADIESDSGFALSGVPAVELNDAVFEREPSELGPERLLIVHLQVQPEVSFMFGSWGGASPLLIGAIRAGALPWRVVN
jgi:hypothetical protein